MRYWHLLIIVLWSNYHSGILIWLIYFIHLDLSYGSNPDVIANFNPYNGLLPTTPAASGALNSVYGIQSSPTLSPQVQVRNTLDYQDRHCQREMFYKDRIIPNVMEYLRHITTKTTLPSKQRLDLNSTSNMQQEAIAFDLLNSKSGHNSGHRESPFLELASPHFTNDKTAPSTTVSTDLIMATM